MSVEAMKSVGHGSHVTRGDNFTTYKPRGDDGGVDSTPRQSLAKLGRAMGAFRYLLLCSRPCFNDSADLDREDSITIPQYEDISRLASKGINGEDWKLRLEMQAVLRHLEVRWQLFNEALSKFGDFEAMLAVCTDNVRWKQCHRVGAKDAQLSEDLQSLIARKLSMDVVIDRITQLLPSGALGSTLDRDGNWGELDPHDRVKAETSLELLHEKGGGMGNEACRERMDGARFSVLENDTYTLCDQKGEIVEEGRQVVIWEQQNSTWYIRGCVSYPFSSQC